MASRDDPDGDRSVLMVTADHDDSRSGGFLFFKPSGKVRYSIFGHPIRHTIMKSGLSEQIEINRFSLNNLRRIVERFSCCLSDVFPDFQKLVLILPIDVDSSFVVSHQREQSRHGHTHSLTTGPV